MKVYPDDRILAGDTYQMELSFPGLGFIQGQVVKLKILGNLDAINIGASWYVGGGDTWQLKYHVKATGRILTHGQMFDQAISTAYGPVVWVDCIDLGLEEPLLTPDIPLPDWLQEVGKHWKLIAIGAISILGLLVALKTFPSRK